jgi:hypothetical protein
MGYYWWAANISGFHIRDPDRKRAGGVVDRYRSICGYCGIVEFFRYECDVRKEYEHHRKPNKHLGKAHEHPGKPYKHLRKAHHHIRGAYKNID